MKPGDHWTISLCREHHAEQHQGEATFRVKYAIDPVALAMEFANKSPQRMKLRRNVGSK